MNGKTIEVKTLDAMVCICSRLNRLGDNFKCKFVNEVWIITLTGGY
jgi:hypothetical protein